MAPPSVQHRAEQDPVEPLDLTGSDAGQVELVAEHDVDELDDVQQADEGCDHLGSDERPGGTAGGDHISSPVRHSSTVARRL